MQNFKHQFFSGFFIAYPEYASNLEHFDLVISEIIDSERVGYLFGKQRVNGFQTLLKSARHHYYRIFT